MTPRRTALAVVLCALPFLVHGQVSDSLTARFFQELDTRTWRLQENYRLATAEYSVLSSGYGSLTERRLPGYESQWKNDLSASLDVSRRLRDNLSAVVEMRGQEFRDRTAAYIGERGNISLYPDGYSFVDETSTSSRPSLGQDSRISRAMGRAGVAWQPRSTVEAKLLAGAAFDDQTEGRGEGLSGSGGLYWGNALESGLDLESEAWINRYGDRRNHQAFVRALTLRTFGDALNQLSASWQNRRSDLFFGSGGQVVSRISEEIRVDNRIMAPLHPLLTGTYDLSYRKTSVDYRGGGPGPGDEMDFINRLFVEGVWGDWLGRLSYRYGLEDRTYGDLILGRNQSLGLDAEWRSGLDSLDIRVSTEKWRFDSPDSLETSDRDRMVHRLNSSLSVQVMDRTRITLETLVLLDHLVNLHRQRSSENRWNRVFRLAPGVEWAPAPGWSNHAVFEILANYTDYDFEQESGGGPRSNVFRRWSAADTVRVPLPYDLRGQLSGRLDLEDRGRLRWDEFVQEVSDEKRAYYGAVSLSRTFWSHLHLHLGYRSQLREEDRLDPAPDGGTLRDRISTYRVHGPYFRATTWGFRNLRVFAEVALQTVDDSSPTGRDRLDRFDIQVIYRW